MAESIAAAVAVDSIAPLEGVAEDVHRALVHYEADRVCRAFHVDGHRTWTVVSGRSLPRGADGLDDPRLQPLTIAICYNCQGSTRASRSPMSIG